MRDEISSPDLEIFMLKPLSQACTVMVDITVYNIVHQSAVWYLFVERQIEPAVMTSKRKCHISGTHSPNVILQYVGCRQ